MGRLAAGFLSDKKAYRTALVKQPAVTQQDLAVAEFEAASSDACAFARASISMNTKRAYASDWEDFHSWCGSPPRATPKTGH